MQVKLTRPLAVFDLETTGVDIVLDRIVELSIIRLETDGSKRVKSMRINPTISIPKESSAIHGIYDEDVVTCPTFEQVAQEIYDFINPCDLAGFNSNRFDVPILVEEFFRCDLNLELENRKLIDAFSLYVAKEKRDLASAYKFYCGKTLINAHSAEADATATMEILLGQFEKYPELDNQLDLVDELINTEQFIDTGRRLIMQDGEPAFNFGKHKGRTVAEVLEKEPGYYSWIMQNQFPLHTKKKLTEIKNSLRRQNKF